MNGYHLARHPAIPEGVTGYSIHYDKTMKKWRVTYAGKAHKHVQSTFHTEALAALWLKQLVAEHNQTGDNITQAFLCKAWIPQTDKRAFNYGK